MFGAELLCTPVMAAGGSGPLLLDDLAVAPFAAYSTGRKLRSAYSGAAFRLRRASDSTEMDIGFTGSAVDTATMTSFLSAETSAPYVSKLYNQGSAGSVNDWLQTVASSQPIMYMTGLNGLPTIATDDQAIHGNAGNYGCFVTSASAHGPAGTLFQACIVHQPAATNYAIGLNFLGSNTSNTGNGYGAGQFAMDRFIDGSSPVCRAIASGQAAEASITAGVAEQLSLTTSGSTAATRVNRVAANSTAVTMAFDASGQWMLGGSDSGNVSGSNAPGQNWWDGYWSEMIFAAGANASDLTAIEASQHSFWGTP